MVAITAVPNCCAYRKFLAKIRHPMGKEPEGEYRKIAHSASDREGLIPSVILISLRCILALDQGACASLNLFTILCIIGSFAKESIVAEEEILMKYCSY
jgi:hypothetical protein